MGELQAPFAPGGRAPVKLLIGGNCAGLVECGGSLGDSHIRLVGAVMDMMKENGKAPKTWKFLCIRLDEWGNSRVYVGACSFADDGKYR